MARPRKDQADARVVRFNLRFTRDEWPSVEAKALESGLSPTELCRRAVLGARIEAAQAQPGAAPLAPSAKTPDGIEHIVALNRIGVNLNQIARTLNAGLGYEPEQLAQSLERVNQLLDAWQGVAP